MSAWARLRPHSPVSLPSSSAKGSRAHGGRAGRGPVLRGGLWRRLFCAPWGQQRTVGDRPGAVPHHGDGIFPVSAGLSLSPPSSSPPPPTQGVPSPLPPARLCCVQGFISSEAVAVHMLGYSLGQKGPQKAGKSGSEMGLHCSRALPATVANRQQATWSRCPGGQRQAQSPPAAPN